MTAAVAQPIPDALPPHAEDAERAVLGCILLDPTVLRSVRERFATEEVFYDLRHQVIFAAMCSLDAEGRTADIVSVVTRLKDLKRLEEVGGIAYLTSCENEIPSVQQLPQWLDMVWEKKLARSALGFSTLFSRRIQTQGALSESLLEGAKQDLAGLEALSAAQLSAHPKNLCACSDFGDAYYNAWFKTNEEEYGYELPFKFPLRIRPSELTLFTGDNGSGKSSMLGLISITCAKQFKADEMVIIASMEVPPEITLWIMARQLLGVGKLECNELNIAKITRALAWLNKRVLLYNFLGITDWRELLNTFRYARANRHGAVFIVDSVMRIGIPDDDYALQGIVAAQFADFSVKQGAHTFLVVHENKGDGRAKDKVRGSKQWTDNAHNVCGMKRNEAKAEKLEELKAENAAGELSNEDFEKKKIGMRKLWDAKFILSKQRWPGSQQNASRWLYFDHEALQFHEQPGDWSFDFTL